MTEFSIIAVFFVGLLGGVHCLGMCGSIVGILTGQLPKDGARWPFHLAYNSGRIASYTVAGMLVGAIGQAGMLFRDAVPVQHLLFALSSLMLIALGLYLAGLWSMVRRIEQLGSVLWQRIQPLTRFVFPITSPLRALLLGMLWGWLPCGLVYSVLVTALASGHPQSGALIMLAFGLGTLPNLRGHRTVLGALPPLGAIAQSPVIGRPDRDGIRRLWTGKGRLCFCCVWLDWKLPC